MRKATREGTSELFKGTIDELVGWLETDHLVGKEKYCAKANIRRRVNSRLKIFFFPLGEKNSPKNKVFKIF